MATRDLDSPPSILPLYARAAAPLVPGASLLPFVPGGGGEIPELELELTGVARRPERARRLRPGVRLRPARHLPPTYPHVLAFPLHMAVMADGGFPFGAVGLVHVENRIAQHRPIGVGEELDARACAPTTLQPHPKGRTFALVTEARVGRRDRLGGATSTMLRRGKRRSRRRPAAASAVAEPHGAGRRRRAPSGARRRPRPPLRRGLRRPQPDPHARADREAARLPAAIAHGMWTKARCLAALEGRLPDAFTVEVRFRKPILLPGRVEFASADDGEEIDFAVRDAKRGDAAPRRHIASPRPDEADGAMNDAPRQGVAERSMGVGLRGAEPARRLRPARPIRIRKQVERALFRDQGRLPHGDRRRPHLQGRPDAAANRPARRPATKSLFDLTPDDEQQMFQEAVATSPSRECARPPRGRRRRRRRRSCSPRPTSSASTCSASPRSSAA